MKLSLIRNFHASSGNKISPDLFQLRAPRLNEISPSPIRLEQSRQIVSSNSSRHGTSISSPRQGTSVASYQKGSGITSSHQGSSNAPSHKGTNSHRGTSIITNPYPSGRSSLTPTRNPLSNAQTSFNPSNFSSRFQMTPSHASTSKNYNSHQMDLQNLDKKLMEDTLRYMQKASQINYNAMRRK